MNKNFFCNDNLFDLCIYNGTRSKSGGHLKKRRFCITGKWKGLHDQWDELELCPYWQEL